MDLALNFLWTAFSACLADEGGRFGAPFSTWATRVSTTAPVAWVAQVEAILGPGALPAMASMHRLGPTPEGYGVQARLLVRNGTRLVVSLGLQAGRGGYEPAPARVASLVSPDGAELPEELAAAMASGGPLVPLPALGFVRELRASLPSVHYHIHEEGWVRVRLPDPDAPGGLAALRRIVHLADRAGVALVGTPATRASLDDLGFAPSGRGGVRREPLGPPAPREAPADMPVSDWPGLSSFRPVHRPPEPPRQAVRPCPTKGRPARKAAPAPEPAERPPAVPAPDVVAATAVLRRMVPGDRLLDAALGNLDAMAEAGHGREDWVKQVGNVCRKRIREGWLGAVVRPLARAHENPLHREVQRGLPPFEAKDAAAAARDRLSGILPEIPAGTTARTHAEGALAYLAAAATVEAALAGMPPQPEVVHDRSGWEPVLASNWPIVGSAPATVAGFRARVRGLASSGTITGRARDFLAGANPEGLAGAPWRDAFPRAMQRAHDALAFRHGRRDRIPVAFVHGLLDDLWTEALADLVPRLLIAVPGLSFAGFGLDHARGPDGVVRIRLCRDGVVLGLDVTYTFLEAAPGARLSMWYGDPDDPVPVGEADDLSGLDAAMLRRTREDAALRFAFAAAGPAKSLGLALGRTGLAGAIVLPKPNRPTIEPEDFAPIVAAADGAGISLLAGVDGRRLSSRDLADLGFSWGERADEALMTRHPRTGDPGSGQDRIP